MIKKFNISGIYRKLLQQIQMSLKAHAKIILIVTFVWKNVINFR
jgi:hypothetical protein